MPATWVDRSASWNDAAKYLKISGILFYYLLNCVVKTGSFLIRTGR
jgi:hypothetical protein